MSYFETDLIKRMIQKLALFLARIARANASHQDKLAEELIAQASRDLLGLEYQALASVDVPSAELLLKTPAKVRVYAELVEAEAQALEVRGDQARAALRHQRAAALRVLAPEP